MGVRGRGRQPAAVLSAVGTNGADLSATSSEGRVIHGASLNAYGPTVVPTWRRDFNDPATVEGFRCARSP